MSTSTLPASLALPVEVADREHELGLRVLALETLLVDVEVALSNGDVVDAKRLLAAYWDSPDGPVPA